MPVLGNERRHQVILDFRAQRNRFARCNGELPAGRLEAVVRHAKTGVVHRARENHAVDVGVRRTLDMSQRLVKDLLQTFMIVDEDRFDVRGVFTALQVVEQHCCVVETDKAVGRVERGHRHVLAVRRRYGIRLVRDPDAFARRQVVQVVLVVHRIAHNPVVIRVRYRSCKPVDVLDRFFTGTRANKQRVVRGLDVAIAG